MKKNVLYISTIFPYPAYRGGKIRISNLIARLSRDHDVHLLSLCAEHRERIEDSLREARKHCTTVQAISHSRNRWKGALRSVLTQQPYEIGLFRNEAMKEAVAEAVTEIDPDIIWCSRTASLQYLPNHTRATVLLDQHDLSSQMWRLMKEGSSKWWIRLYAAYNHYLMRKYERTAYHGVDIAVSVSEKERALTETFAPPETALLVAPNGVDVSYFSPSGTTEEDPEAVVSVGSMDQERNIDAAIFFVEDVMPLIRKAGVDMKYYIVGQNPTERVQRLADHDDVVVTGTVDDVRPYLERAAAVVAPYRMGSGVKHKIPISFAMQKAVVATPNACQGIEVTHGQNVLMGETPRELAAHTKTLLQSKEKRDAIGHAAQEFIREHYSWDAIANRLIAQVEEEMG